MEQFKRTNAISKRIKELKDSGATIGFVPTMGALHAGHLSLIKESKAQTDYTVVSIFVNPNQFNNKNDLLTYPRTIDIDLKMLREENCDIVFIPTVEEVYPEEDKRIFDFGYIEKIMEGKHRPCHFNGVAQVVSRLFDIVKPHKAFFGQKDFQQLVIIRMLVEKYMPESNIDIVACPIIREKDGLAMSSRNVRLNKEQRKLASEISQTLFEIRDKIIDHKLHSKEQVLDYVSQKINNYDLMELEYFEIVDENTIKPIIDLQDNKKKVACIAVHVGTIRLIDNITF